MKILQINSLDNVAVALFGLAKGEEGALEAIPRGHKIALKNIAKGENVIKYGMVLGHATQDIPAGTWVHSHNLKTNLAGTLEYQYNPVAVPPVEKVEKRTFMGYLRKNGDVGIRNEVWIIPTVGCVNKLAENLAKHSNGKALALVHPYGCSQLGDDHNTTAQLLAALAKHPNAGGVLVVALGCENNTLESFITRLGDFDASRIKFIKAQDAGDEFEKGCEILDSLIAQADRDVRTEQPLTKLKVGLKCGASDGFSGISANPLIGKFSDTLIAHGGTSVLSEVPEMFGAETLLMERCESKEVFDRCVQMINGFKDYFLRYNQVVYENPSPGNKEGGITTLEEKSLGCTQKGGTGKVVDVLLYGDSLKKPGLNLLTGPGNDMVATTVLAASGVQLVLFSTGRGTPFGGVVPTVKISTNSEIAARKSSWIDFDAGRLFAGVSLDELNREFFDYVLELASGRVRAKNEIYGYQEIAIFKDGVTL